MDAVAGNLPDDVTRDIFLRFPAIDFVYDDYLSEEDGDSEDDDEGYSKEQLAQVYTLGMNCWRKVETVPDEDIFVDEYGYCKSPAFLNGVIHWLGYKRRTRRTDPKPKVVISFNVSSEEFQWFPLPDYVVKDARTVEINVYRDMLLCG
ncbi:hypothetical protein COLO4_12909 [Corchorus olitorius]|uniref:F-box associated beta-propeller type 3 domain-containing protein n=1 Tax=Corchorus olitorius TaxID=93759 RepID=A0A1R3JZ45_9ROSI|nr:hypothetical protein COLO4_12909 [Corchorus olitorius]